MNVLGIDCCTRITNLGLVSNGEILSEINLDLKRKQSEMLPNLVYNLLKSNNLKLNDIDLISVTNGPGFYTGIRTGLSYSTSLSFALSKKILPVVSLESMAYSLKDKYTHIVSVIKARKKSLYYAIYEIDKNITTLVNPQYSHIDKLLKEISAFKELCIVGNDYKEYDELLALKNVTFEDKPQTGGSTALLGFERYTQSIDPLSLQGMYLRKPDIGPLQDE
ncbi:MAG: tRNA (adenosine(37)-N6)-threonylcarbamoyltransferase complex dimerization subunit type 1 TsaB [Synergistaceae bacterium]